MIEQLKNAPPFIDFGFGRTHLQVAVGEPVTVWLNTLYNQDVYSFNLTARGTITKISNYEYEVMYTQPGSYEVKLGVSTSNKKVSLESNVLTLIVNGI
jgi:plastocyanin